MAKSVKYSVSFTIGSLFINETNHLLDFLIQGNLKENTTNIVKENLVRINAESSRARIIREIYKRSKFVDNELWRIYKESNPKERAIILFYTCCKTFKFIFDFQSEVVLEKFRTFNLDLTNNDVNRFIDKKSITYPELESWSDKRKKSVNWSLFSILEQAGLLKENKITPLNADDHFWFNFIKLGDPWFLELALLNKQQRDSIEELYK